MSILIALKTGIIRAQGSWRGIAAVWLVTLILAAMIALPARGALSSALGFSTITERLEDGLDIEVFADMEGFGRIASSFGTGLIFLLLLYFAVNAFLSGGLFENVRGTGKENTSSSFWSAAARRFIPFLVIHVIMYLIIIVLFLVIFVVPFSVMISDVNEEMFMVKAGIVCFSIFLLFLTLMITVADYARAWQVTQERNRSLMAVAFGFRQTFRTFFTSLGMMLLILIIQVLYWAVVLKFLPGMKPSGVGSLFMFFLLSQAMFMIKILLRVFRYGCVTSMMEQTTGNRPLP